MTLFRTVDPAVEPVTLAEAKAHLVPQWRRRIAGVFAFPPLSDHR